jgi:hypothetical protein
MYYKFSIESRFGNMSLTPSRNPSSTSHFLLFDETML